MQRNPTRQMFIKFKGNRAKSIAFSSEPVSVNYNEPVFHWLCCYLFYRRKHQGRDNVIVRITPTHDSEVNTTSNLAQEVKTLKFAQLLNFQDEMTAEKHKLGTARKVLELKRQEIPREYRLYNRGKPAPAMFTEEILRQESRIALLTSLENYGK